MSLPLTLTEHRWLVAQLAKLDVALTPTSQRAFIRDAFYGSPRLDDIASRISYSEKPRNFAINLLDMLGERFKQDTPGRTTISVLLTGMLGEIGDGPEAQEILRLLDKCGVSTQPIAPAAAGVPQQERPAVAPPSVALAPELRSELNLVLWSLGQSAAASASITEEARQTAIELRQWASAFLADQQQLAAQMRAQVDALTQHSASENQYLLATLPIIPGILSYNVEIGSQHQLDLKALWGRIKVRFWPADKGMGPATRARPSVAVLNSGQARAVFVGINDYAPSSGMNPLRYCVADASALQKLLARRYLAARLLVDGALDPAHAPTRGNVLNELQLQADAAEAGDLLLFTFSGHGDVRDGKSLLLPRDVTGATLNDMAIPVERVLAIIKASSARAKVLILDACHSGAEIGKSGGSQMSAEFIQRVYEQAEGVAVLSSSRQGQRSYEAPEFGHGVFTHYLLEALSGRADFAGKDFVTVSDAAHYVSGMVKTWAAARGCAQSPTLAYTVDGDIILNRYT